MKRADGLFEKIISDENLDLAIKKVNASHHWRPRHIPNKCTAWVERTKDERREAEWIRERVEDGRIVIPDNKLHACLKPMGIGRELKTKINANIGTSPTTSCIEQELRKLDAAVKYGADTVMDLSTGDNLDQTRRAIIEHSVIPVGTVPIYELACRCGSDDSIDFS